MYIETEDYRVNYSNFREYIGLCSMWTVTLAKYPEDSFTAICYEEGENRGEVAFLYNTMLEDNKEYMKIADSLERKIKNAISLLNSNLI